LNLQLGGGAVLDAVIGYLRWASALLRARCTDDIGRQLRVTLADLYNVAGLSLHDCGRHREANRHFMQGLVLAGDLEDRELTANLLWAMGRVSLEQEHAPDALRFFQLAQIAALDTGSHAELARLHSNEAKAYALLGKPQLVEDALARAGHEYSHALAAQEPATFHGAAWYLALQSDDPLFNFAVAHGILARSNDGIDRSATRSAELAADTSTRLLAPNNLPGRLRALRQITLADALLCARERETGLTAAHQAVDQVTVIRSVRTADRLRHLAQAAKAWPRDRDALDLRSRIAAVRIGRPDVPLADSRTPAGGLLQFDSARTTAWACSRWVTSLRSSNRRLEST
jgi:tetratricopeptide (TPR) repeat protein